MSEVEIETLVTRVKYKLGGAAGQLPNMSNDNGALCP